MNKFFTIIISLIILLGCQTFGEKKIRLQESIVETGNIKLWSESFGNKADPAILLIIGAGSQSILWPTEFCRKLANQGFYVIRYDTRDTGKSSEIDYNKDPYTAMDLAKDAIAILDHHKIDKANIVGFSMGGQTAQFIGAYFPKYASTLTLIATSTSFREGFDAFRGIYDSQGLSPPKDYYVNWATKIVDNEQTMEEKIQDFIQSWRLLNGDKIEFDKEIYNSIAKESFARSKLNNPYPKHALAMQSSYKKHQEAPSKINIKTLIIHGDADPVFGVDHAYSLRNTIKDSRLEIIQNMGHALNTNFYDKVVRLISEHIKQL